MDPISTFIINKYTVPPLQYLEWQSIVLLKIGEKSFLQTGPNVLERRNVGIHTKATCNTFYLWLECWIFVKVCLVDVPYW